jgi:mono/diheme cytochrome c family protein
VNEFPSIVRTCTGLALGVLAAPRALGQDAVAGPSDTAEFFRSTCSACHVPPDPRFAVERAWLEQVRDTA